jgi:hypothetical protein
MDKEKAVIIARILQENLPHNECVSLKIVTSREANQ